MKDTRFPLASVKLSEIYNRERKTLRKSRQGLKRAGATSAGFSKARYAHFSVDRGRIGRHSTKQCRQDENQLTGQTLAPKLLTRSEHASRPIGTRLRADGMESWTTKPKVQRQGSSTSYERRRYVMTFGGLKRRASTEACSAARFAVGTRFSLKKRMTGRELSDLKAATSGDISVRPAVERHVADAYGAPATRADDRRTPRESGTVAIDGGERAVSAKSEAKEATPMYMDNITCDESYWDLRECFEEVTRVAAASSGRDDAHMARMLVDLRTDPPPDHPLVVREMAAAGTCDLSGPATRRLGANAFPRPTPSLA